MTTKQAIQQVKALIEMRDQQTSEKLSDLMQESIDLIMTTYIDQPTPTDYVPC